MAEENKKLPLSHPTILICTWFWSGLSRKAPGTMGSIAALPFGYVIHSLWGQNALLLASIIAFFVGWAATNHYLKFTDSKDPKEVVIDEVAGQWFVLSFFFPTLNSYITGLIIFRFFDIFKPWPISWVDKNVKGGLGVMLDDMVAAFLPFVVVGLIIMLGKISGLEIEFTGFMQFMGASPHVQ
jgi:phosphatidylglycerophosphatase A